MNEQPKSNRGGYRPGAGRKIKDPAGQKRVSTTYTCTPRVHSKIRALIELHNAEGPVRVFMAAVTPFGSNGDWQLQGTESHVYGDLNDLGNELRDNDFDPESLVLGENLDGVGYNADAFYIFVAPDGSRHGFRFELEPTAAAIGTDTK